MLKSWRKMKVKGSKRKQTKSLTMENTLKKRKRNNRNKPLNISREKANNKGKSTMGKNKGIYKQLTHI